MALTFTLEFADLFRGRALIVPTIALTLPRGRPIGVVGVNGAGKSTLLMAAAGVLMPSGCRIGGGYTENSRVGYAPQEHACFRGIRVEDHCRLFGLDLGQMIETLPDLYLHEIQRKRVDTLSPGQRQALVNGIALSVSAELVVFDEPFSALDVRRRTGLREYIRQAACDRPVLLASQAGADLITLCEHYILLRAGRIVFDGALTDLVESTTDPARLADCFEEAVVKRIR